MSKIKMGQLKEVVLNASEFREGETAKVLPVELRFVDGESIRGIGKIYPSLEHAQKEINVLKSLESRNLGTAKVLDVRDLREYLDHDGVVVVESKVSGETIAEIGHPRPLEEVQQASRLIFDQLSAVASNDELVKANEGFCGDISSANVIDSPRGYSIIDWSGRFGMTGEPELTQGYIAPEIFNGVGEEGLHFVEADTFSLGSLLARVLIGRDTFRGFTPRHLPDAHIKFNQVEPLVPQEVHAFFKIALSEDPKERSPKGAKTPAEHYRRLKGLFLGEQ